MHFIEVWHTILPLAAGLQPNQACWCQAGISDSYSDSLKGMLQTTPMSHAMHSMPPAAFNGNHIYYVRFSLYHCIML